MQCNNGVTVPPALDRVTLGFIKILNVSVSGSGEAPTTCIGHPWGKKRAEQREFSPILPIQAPAWLFCLETEIYDVSCPGAEAILPAVVGLQLANYQLWGFFFPSTTM